MPFASPRSSTALTPASSRRAVFYYFYTFATKVALSVFDCSAVAVDGENTWFELDAEPSVRCQQIIGPINGHPELWRLGLLAIAVYCVGAPLALIAIVYRNRVAMREDQLLRVHGEGSTRATNPHYDFRKKYFKVPLPISNASSFDRLLSPRCLFTPPRRYTTVTGLVSCRCCRRSARSAPPSHSTMCLQSAFGG